MTDGMFSAADQIREVTAHVAEAVARAALDEGIAGRFLDNDHIVEAVREAMWIPAYPAEEPVSAEACEVKESMTVYV